MYIHNPSKPRQLEVCSHDYTVVLADVKTEIPLSVSLWRLMSTAVGPGWGLPDMGDKSPWVTAFCLVCAHVCLFLLSAFLLLKLTPIHFPLLVLFFCISFQAKFFQRWVFPYPRSHIPHLPSHPSSSVFRCTGQFSSRHLSASLNQTRANWKHTIARSPADNLRSQEQLQKKTIDLLSPRAILF